MKNAVLSLLFFAGTIFTLTSAGLSSSTLNASPASCIYECGQTADEQFTHDFKKMTWDEAHNKKCEFLEDCYDGCI